MMYSPNLNRVRSTKHRKMKYIIVETWPYTSDDYDDMNENGTEYVQSLEMFPVESIVKMYTRGSADDWIIAVVMKDSEANNSISGTREFYIEPCLDDYNKVQNGKSLFSEDTVKREFMDLQNCLNNGGLY